MAFNRSSPAENQARNQARREASFAAIKPLERCGNFAGGVSGVAVAKTEPKQKGEPKSKIRQSANGEDCLVRLPGVCTFDPTKTIWSHARWGAAGKGKSLKALDLCGAYACTACDAAYDQMTGAKHLTREQIDADWMQGHLRSLVRLAEKGLI